MGLGPRVIALTSCDMIASTPGGRLTLVAGMPELNQNNVDYSSGELHYSPFAGDTAPIFNEVQWDAIPFTSGPLDPNGLSMAGGAKWVANTQRDVFIVNVGSCAKLATGPAWPDPKASTEDRNLIRRNGVWVTSASMPLDLSETESIEPPANCATWVGSINPALDGILTATFTLGQKRRCDIWNLYYQTEIALGVQQPPVGGQLVEYKPSNQYPAWLAINNDNDNYGLYFSGLGGNTDSRLLARGFFDSLNFGPCAAILLICEDNLSNPRGTFGGVSSDTFDDASGFASQAHFKDRSAIGVHKVIMAAANANNIHGITLWGSNADHSVYPQENYHVMWITYQG